MKALVKAAAVVAVAVLALVGGAALNLRSDEDSEGANRALASTPSGSALLRPVGAAGSLDATVAALQDRLRAIPEDWRGFASLGLAYVAQARITADPSWYPKAEGALRESLRLQTEGNVEALLGLGALALARHDFEGALEHGVAARELDPYEADAYGVIGDAQLELGRYEEAVATFQAMVDTKPDVASYARASYARELLGDVPGAIDAMRRAFEASGAAADATWAAFQLGELEMGRGSLTAAATWYERGLDLEPAYAPNLAGLARVSWARGDDARAVRRYADAVAALPSVEHVAALGDLYASIGREDLAREQYAVVEATRALAEANGVDVDLEVAVFDADHGRPRSALEAARAEWARRPSVHVADAYAWALYSNGRYGRAAAMAHRALALGTRNATFLFHAGMIELARGHHDGARRLLREALATNPYFSILHASTARQTLARLEATR